MGRVAGATSRIYCNEHNWSGRSNSIEASFDVNLPEVTCFLDSAGEFVEGQYGSRVAQNSFFDGDDGEIDENIFDEIGAASAALLGIYLGQDASYSDIGYEYEARPNDQARPISVAGAVLLNCTWQVSGPAVRSTVLCNGAVTATGAVTNSNQNIGTTTSGEVFVAVIRALSVSGSGTIIVDIEQSSDDGSGDAYELISGVQATFTAVGAQRKTTTSATEAWKRVNVTTFTGFTSVTLMVAVGKEQGVS